MKENLKRQKRSLNPKEPNPNKRGLNLREKNSDALNIHQV